MGARGIAIRTGAELHMWQVFEILDKAGEDTGSSQYFLDVLTQDVCTEDQDVAVL